MAKFSRNDPDVSQGNTPAHAEPAAVIPSKKVQLLAKLQSPDGISIEELTEEFGWQPHSARAMLSGLRKAGHMVDRTKQGSVTVYRIAS